MLHAAVETVAQGQHAARHQGQRVGLQHGVALHGLGQARSRIFNQGDAVVTCCLDMHNGLKVVSEEGQIFTGGEQLVESLGQLVGVGRGFFNGLVIFDKFQGEISGGNHNGVGGHGAGGESFFTADLAGVAVLHDFLGPPTAPALG